MGSITVLPGVGGVVHKGEEIGFFEFGGSSIALVFEYGRVTFDADLVQHAQARVEDFVHVATRIATANS